MEKVPDMDDLLDQLESCEVHSPCFTTNKVSSRNAGDDIDVLDNKDYSTNQNLSDNHSFKQSIDSINCNTDEGVQMNFKDGLNVVNGTNVICLSTNSGPDILRNNSSSNLSLDDKEVDPEETLVPDQISTTCTNDVDCMSEESGTTIDKKSNNFELKMSNDLLIFESEKSFETTESEVKSNLINRVDNSDTIPVINDESNKKDESEMANLIDCLLDLGSPIAVETLSEEPSKSDSVQCSRNTSGVLSSIFVINSALSDESEQNSVKDDECEMKYAEMEEYLASIDETRSVNIEESNKKGEKLDDHNESTKIEGLNSSVKDVDQTNELVISTQNLSVLDIDSLSVVSFSTKISDLNQMDKICKEMPEISPKDDDSSSSLKSQELNDNIEIPNEIELRSEVPEVSEHIDEESETKVENEENCVPETETIKDLSYTVSVESEKNSLVEENPEILENSSCDSALLEEVDLNTRECVAKIDAHSSSCEDSLTREARDEKILILQEDKRDLMDSQRLSNHCENSGPSNKIISEKEENKEISCVHTSDEYEKDEQTVSKDSEEMNEVKNNEESDSICPTPSVVTDTLVIGQLNVTRLTESELMLGKVKPVWIADADASSCMLCCNKFTVILRRHHCRCCGRVLCATCTPHKISLAYVNDVRKKMRVCEPCAKTLQRIDEYEKSRQLNTDPTSSSLSQQTSRSNRSSRVSQKNIKSLLKTKGIHSTEGDVSEDVVRADNTTELNRRSVKFFDGVHPGEASSDHEFAIDQPDSSQNVPKAKKIRNSRRETSSRRIKELRMVDEMTCVLPKSDDDQVLVLTGEGKLDKLFSHQCDEIIQSSQELKISICRNIYCTVKVCKSSSSEELVLCIITNGLYAVGLDELLIAYELHKDQPINTPFDMIRRIHEVLEDLLVLEEAKGDTMREIDLQLPLLIMSRRSGEELAKRDFLLHRPSSQLFDSLILPKYPFLIMTFIHPSEILWAKAIPYRLLYRIGLQASCYPTPVINQCVRKPVYDAQIDTTVLKVFTDFRDWAYCLPKITGSTLSLEDNSSHLIIPRTAAAQVQKILTTNSNMLAWALDFNLSADSHLVCDKYDNGTYRTQIFTSGITSRKVTGATFIIIDGALKDVNNSLALNVVEDGIAIRMHPNYMPKLLESLQFGKDFEIILPSSKFFLSWIDFPLVTVGGMKSAVDEKPLLGLSKFGLSKLSILGTLYGIAGVSEYAIRLASIYDIDGGSFSSMNGNKILLLCEQVADQVAQTLSCFVFQLISFDIRHIHVRIKVTPDEAEYWTAQWPGMEQEHLLWTELLDSQLVPGLYNVCSYISTSFCVELHLPILATKSG